MKTDLKTKFTVEENETPSIRDKKEKEFKKMFSENLSIFLNNTGISNRELADNIGYTEQHCSNLKQGNDAKAPSLFCLYRICSALEISPDYLWNFNNNLSSSEKSIDSKKEHLLNKIKKVNNEDIIDGLIHSLDTYLKLQSLKDTNDDNDIEY